MRGNGNVERETWNGKRGTGTVERETHAARGGPEGNFGNFGKSSGWWTQAENLPTAQAGKPGFRGAAGDGAGWKPAPQALTDEAQRGEARRQLLPVRCRPGRARRRRKTPGERWCGARKHQPQSIRRRALSLSRSSTFLYFYFPVFVACEDRLVIDDDRPAAASRPRQGRPVCSSWTSRTGRLHAGGHLIDGGRPGGKTKTSPVTKLPDVTRDFSDAPPGADALS